MFPRRGPYGEFLWPFESKSNDELKGGGLSAKPHGTPEHGGAARNGVDGRSGRNDGADSSSAERSRRSDCGVQAQLTDGDGKGRENPDPSRGPTSRP